MKTNPLLAKLRQHVTGKISSDNPAIVGIPSTRITMTDRELYLSYVNNFLTITRFADYYGLTRADALALIDAERESIENAPHTN